METSIKWRTVPQQRWRRCDARGEHTRRFDDACVEVTNADDELLKAEVAPCPDADLVDKLGAGHNATDIGALGVDLAQAADPSGSTSDSAVAPANDGPLRPLGELVDTHASLRRLAMLVAQGAPPDEVFAAVTREALRHFGGGTARLIRYEPDGTATLLANQGVAGAHVRVGELWEGFPADGLTASVRQTGSPCRVDDYCELPDGNAYVEEG